MGMRFIPSADVYFKNCLFIFIILFYYYMLLFVQPPRWPFLLSYKT